MKKAVLMVVLFGIAVALTGCGAMFDSSGNSFYDVGHWNKAVWK